MLGAGLLVYLKSSTPIAIVIGIMPVIAIGMGLLFATSFSALAPLAPSANAAALSFLTFMRTFPQVKPLERAHE
jgi:hypothetical protein